MSKEQMANIRGSRFGAFLVLRAIPAAALAAVITFSADHSSIVGQIAFLTYGFVIAPVLLMTAFGSGFGSRVRTAYLVASIASVGAAATMAALIATMSMPSAHDSLRIFTLVVGIWAAVSGVSELMAGWFHTDRSESREMFALGGFTAALAAVELLLPLNEIFAVGLLGAYGAIIAVFAAIAGFSIGFSSQSIKKGNS